jgi:hypothetical protein
MRHVSNIIGAAIRDEIFVPWDLVHAKASLRGTKSTLVDHEAVALEHPFLIPTSRTPSRTAKSEAGRLTEWGDQKVCKCQHYLHKFC